MILTTLGLADKYKDLHEGFSSAFDYLRNNSFREMEPGEYEISGKEIFAIVADLEGKGMDKSTLETHKKYIDIQYTVSGSEVIGWRSGTDCVLTDGGYSEERDLEFFRETPDSWIEVPRGDLAIFFPEDAHAPLAGTGQMRKVIIKVKV